jgi:hypothetical protein
MEAEMELDHVPAFFITPAARAVLGEQCIANAFDWALGEPVLRRLTFGELDADVICQWNETCDDAKVSPVLLLGPGDATPDLTANPGLFGIHVLTAHELDTLDMKAMRELLHEPDEIFTAYWGEFADGERFWFVPPGPPGLNGRSFWKAYSSGLEAYRGPVLGLGESEFVDKAKAEWRCQLSRDDLYERQYVQGGTVRFVVARFPFCAIAFDTRSRQWTTEGWLPDDLDRVDPDGSVRRACEAEMQASGLLATPSGTTAGTTASSAGDAAAAWSRLTLDALIADAQCKVLLDRLRLSEIEDGPDDARGAGAAPELAAMRGGDASDARATDRNADRAQEASAGARGGGSAPFSRLVWSAEYQTLFIFWMGSYAKDHLSADAAVRAGVEIDGQWHEFEAAFRTDMMGVNFGQVKVSVPDEFKGAVLASSLELRVTPDEATGKGRLMVLFRQP